MGVWAGWSDLDVGRSMRENIRDIIFEATPTDTPVFDMTGNVATKSPFHGWLYENLAAYADNAQGENQAFTFNDTKLQQTRLFNSTQIFTKEIRISRSNQRTAHYGMNDLLAYELAKKGRLLKTDIEAALIKGVGATGPASTATVRRMDGLMVAASGNSNYTQGTLFTLNETRLNDFFQRQWDIYNGTYDLLCNGALKRRLSGLTANQGSAITGTTAATANSPGLNLFRDQNDQVIVNTISQYISDFGPSEIHLCRAMPKPGAFGPGGTGQIGTGLNLAASIGSLLLVDRTNLRKAWIDEPFVERTAKVADGFDAVIIAEVTLEYGNPGSIGSIHNIY